MLEHIAIFLPDGKPLKEIHIGSDGVKKAFFDKEDQSVLIVLCEDNIVEYHGMLYVAQKGYKVQAE